ncbi:hypothetical protein SR870_04695 [Rhodopseudomonas palustris]|uniref:hypothetical protein n=1 Tax=Rhodopseudomonas palustris TaxID=1076 RepID=UPI002ACD596D|nr:hypothetical protein [Rhodopseudomonas palustris]WQH00593.1 hypothetical protein SR870_04695 [Rhodopseudomonas palustris]
MLPAPHRIVDPVKAEIPPSQQLTGAMASSLVVLRIPAAILPAFGAVVIAGGMRPGSVLRWVAGHGLSVRALCRRLIAEGGFCADAQDTLLWRHFCQILG